MTVTNQFFLWFYYGLSGLGGWFLFFLLAVAAVVWQLYDSQKRRLPALGWRMGIVLVAALVLPAILYRFTVDDPSDTLAPFAEPIFYLGLLGGVLPPVIAAGYFVTFQGLVGCPHGHIYEIALGECPECARLATPPPAPPMPAYTPPVVQPMGSVPSGTPPQPPKPKAQAWLIASDGHSYQLNQGETTIGRSPTNDIQLSGDTTVSRQHVKILEQNNHFRLIDLGGKNHTRVNGHIVRQPVLLEHNDEIQLGDNTHLRFITTR